jgi:phosphatidylglycerophosphate synthase
MTSFILASENFMNPFVAFLIVVPLFVSIVLFVGAFFGLIQHGPRSDIIAAIIILAIMSCALGFLLVKTSKTRLIEFPGRQQVDVAVRRRETIFLLTIIYGGLILIAVLVFKIEHIRNWLGAICTVLASLIIYSGIHQLKQANGNGCGSPADFVGGEIRRYEAFLSTYKKTRSWLVASSLTTAFCLSVLFWLLNGDRYISVLDLVGLLFLLGGIVIWFRLIGRLVQKKMFFLRHKDRFQV